MQEEYLEFGITAHKGKFVKCPDGSYGTIKDVSAKHSHEVSKGLGATAVMTNGRKYKLSDIEEYVPDSLIIAKAMEWLLS